MNIYHRKVLYNYDLVFLRYLLSFTFNAEQNWSFLGFSFGLLAGVGVEVHFHVAIGLLPRVVQGESLHELDEHVERRVPADRGIYFTRKPIPLPRSIFLTNFFFSIFLKLNYKLTAM